MCHGEGAVVPGSVPRLGLCPRPHPTEDPSAQNSPNVHDFMSSASLTAMLLRTGQVQEEQLFQKKQELLKVSNILSLRLVTGIACTRHRQISPGAPPST